MRGLRCPILVLLVSGCGVASAVPRISKVDPPNWWPDHSLNPVRLLVYGSGLSSPSVSAPRGLTVSNVRANETGTYLLLDLSIAAGMTPGDYPLTLKTADGSATIPFTLETPLPRAGRFQGFGPDDIIYLIMPDRFANGDSSNDDPSISRGLFDRKKDRFYHGGDLEGIIGHLSYLKALGVTAIWITPVYDNTNKLNARQAVKGQPIADYHGYGTTDYYAVDEHLGTLALLRKLVDQAHAMGIKVIQDQVANHVGPAHPWVSDPPKPTWFHGTVEHHVNETWQIWSLPDPGASAKMKRAVTDGWFQDALPDMNQEDPDVALYEIQNALWWVGMAGFDGIRQDTLPYVSRLFWRDWSAALKKQFPDLCAVGEVFDPDPAVPSFFQGGVTRPDGIDSGIDSVFDFPVYFDTRKVFAAGGEMEILARTLAQDRLYPNPRVLVTFLGNHDTPRFMSEKDATPAKLKLAFTLLFTMRGTPSIYYGDEIGMQGGADPDNRRDFPGGWKNDSRSAFEVAGRTPQENEIIDYVRKLAALRSASQALRKGIMKELSVGPYSLVYLRRFEAEIVIVVLNNGSAEADITVPFGFDGAYKNLLGGDAQLTVKNGNGIVHLPAHSAGIFQTRESQ